MGDNERREEERINQLIDDNLELQRAIDGLNDEFDDEAQEDVRSPFATEGTFYAGDEAVAEVREKKPSDKKAAVQPSSTALQDKRRV